MRNATVVVAAVLVAACARGESQTVEQAPPVPVRLADVVTDEVARPVRATGTVGPKEEVGLGFKVGGVVSAVHVNAGDVVRAGRTLAVLDLAEIDAAVTRAQSALAKADRDLERARRLYRDSVATLSQVQDAETAAEVARADAEAARFNRRHAVITAPADGVILRRSVEGGELVSPGTVALVLGSRARGSVLRAGLSDRDVMRVSRGDTAHVTFEALPGRVLTGTVSEIGAAAQPGTGTFMVEVALPQASALAAGLVGRVEIFPSVRTTARLVPIEAVLEADGSSGFVYVLAADGRSAERRAVTIAFLAGDHAAISAGLDDVGTVITDGAAYLRAGAAVSVVR